MVEEQSIRDQIEDSYFYYNKFEKENLTQPSKHSVPSKDGQERLTRCKKVIIDCDPGGDDAQALMLSLHLGKQHGIEILGITCVAGNGSLDEVVASAQLTMHVCEQPDIPIHRGVEPHKKGSMVSDFFWGPDGFGGALHEFQEQQERGEIKVKDIQDEHAVEYLIRMSKEYEGEITLIALAPLSNIAEAVRKDPDFPKRIKNIVMMGGTYLAQGNTDYYSSEFNIFKDPEGAALVFDSFDDITMLPLETTFFQRTLPLELNRKPYIQLHTPKGRFVADIYRCALKVMQGHYETCDPLAVAVAMHPEIVEEIIERRCFIETKGEMSRGSVIVDWFERYPQVKPRNPVKIITKVNSELMIELMT